MDKAITVRRIRPILRILLRPRERGIHSVTRGRLDWATVEPTFPYFRHHYRVPLAVQYPVMFSDTDMIAEGKVMNLTVFGCAIECAGAAPRRTTLRVRLILPDQAQSLPVEEAEVRWVQGNRMGLQFHKVGRAADFRLHGFVWDRLLERLRTITQEGLLTS
ncbi:MAG: PilZ domain-containing protein [Nitrospira sp. LK70]|nr:PilZ domain-containing protein [Nitrospira sp. LK70]